MRRGEQAACGRGRRPPGARARTLIAVLAVAALGTVAAHPVASATPAPVAEQPIPGALSAPTAALSAPTAARAGLRVPLLSPRRVPHLFTTPVADERLRQQVGAVVAGAPPATCLTVSVRGRPVVRVNGDVPLEPASVLKLLTAAAVLHHARPDEPVATTLVAGGEPKDGVIEGPLWLVGGGDGLLTTAGYHQSLRDRDQTVISFAGIADALAAKGVKEVRGDIVGDDSRYDTVRYLDSWPPRYLIQEAVGPVSALMVNDGVTGYEQAPDRPSTQRQPGDPPLAAAATLHSLLTARGIRVTGGPSVGRAPGNGHEVARIQSTIFDQVDEMLAWSDNTTAELLTKEVGRRSRGSGSTAAGTQEMLAELQRRGIRTDGAVIVDGSGLDHGNRLTCDQITALLDRVGPDSTLARGLPTAGQKGTLLRRMRGTPGEGTVFAKTGTLGTVASLAGFQRTHRGEVVTFAFIQNGPGVSTVLQDRLAEALHRYPDVPDLADLVPPASGQG
jgi:D-alanyl-D-alanine carboxypeptidase/D-alanyl-D-alanine-endopeptidase (penicillin-binding protein 4)